MKNYSITKEIDYDIVHKELDKNPFASVRNVILSVIEDAILTSKLVPGEKLNISKLATQFQVSPTPIREAIEELVGRGFIKVETKEGGKHKNYIVFELGTDDMANLFIVRKAIESLSAYMCATYNWMVDLELLKKLAYEFKQCLAQVAKGNADIDTLLRLADCDREFHNLLVNSTRNQYLIQSYNAVEKELKHLSVRTNKLLENEKLEKVLMVGRHHVSIYNAIKLGFPDTARELMDEHIDFCMNRCLKKG